VTVPVRVAGAEVRFVLETASGLTVLSGSLARRVGVEPDGRTFSGRVVTYDLAASWMFVV
jgi:predicted aspartyl protease